MVNNSELSKSDLNEIAELETLIEERMSQLKNAQKFNLGDYLIRMINYGFPETDFRLQKNSYNVPVKYKVVHIDANNVSYVKQLNSKGKTVGEIICTFSEDVEERYELDPEFVDAVIMQSEENYDPTEQYKEHLNTRKEIIKHNKESKIKLQTCADAVMACLKFNVGDTYWTSSNKYFNVVEINQVTTPTGIWETRRSGEFGVGHVKVRYPKNFPDVEIPIVQWSDGKKEKLWPHLLVRTNLYSRQPMRFKKSSDTI